MKKTILFIVICFLVLTPISTLAEEYNNVNSNDSENGIVQKESRYLPVYIERIYYVGWVGYTQSIERTEMIDGLVFKGTLYYKGFVDPGVLGCGDFCPATYGGMMYEVRP